ncbi:MAG: septation ring formation regulator EzrA [Bacilli bacterium]
MFLSGKIQDIVVIILFSVGGLILLGCLIFFLYKYVFYRQSIKKQIKKIERDFYYLDGLLRGQDSQYIHRLEIISHTNLLYVPIFDKYSKRYQDILSIDDEFASNLITQLNHLVANKQYQGIKSIIDNTVEAIESLRNSVEQLTTDLKQEIKPEEDSRKRILSLKEEYRNVKQKILTQDNSITFIIPSFNKVFAKLDSLFTDFDNHIDSAEYEDANKLIPSISRVILDLKKLIDKIPGLCLQVQQIIPNKISELDTFYQKLINEQYHLDHLYFDRYKEKWNSLLSKVRENLVSLDTTGAKDSCSLILNEIDEMNDLLNKEVTDKEFFISENKNIYHLVVDLEQTFLKLIAILPNLEQVYIIEQEENTKINNLKDEVNRLGGIKRELETLMHSPIPQPYSVLKEKLLDLKNNYDVISVKVEEFKSFIAFLKNSCEESYHLIFAYYYKLKQVESTLRTISIEKCYVTFNPLIENCYDLLNQISLLLKDKPINVKNVNLLVDQLKEVAGTLFDNVDVAYSDAQLAESSIIYANRDRYQRTEVHNELCILEDNFFKGDFKNVYLEANRIYQNNHVEDRSDSGK